MSARRASPSLPPTPPEFRRLGRNLNGYVGETIEVNTVLSDCLAAAQAHGWQIQQLPVPAQAPIHTMSRLRGQGRPVAPGQTGRAGRAYVSSGIHGDEPAGPLAMRKLLQEDLWPPGLDLWLCPCLNPAGFAMNRRENGSGVDLNRQYRNPTAVETAAHIGWLERQPPFDLSLCVHEDWESNGFYVYELNPDNRTSLAEKIVEAVSQVCPIDRSDLIEGRPAREGVIRPNLDPCSRPDWPEAFFLITRKTRLSYTLEAPSDFPISVRVAALVEAILAALANLNTEA